MLPTKRPNFASDYMHGAHPAVWQSLCLHNLDGLAGYGSDPLTEGAKEKIRLACECPNADVRFFTGGTQANATVIAAYLQPWEGVISPDSGHIYTNEAGAVENTGHKILALPARAGKITAEQIAALLADYTANPHRDHVIKPAMVYLSQPTEYGTLYSLEELQKIRAVCNGYGLTLFVDGARLAYALASPENDVTLPDLANLCDVFYIGGTKCGALFGEAVVIPDGGSKPYFLTVMKQHGALLAKGWTVALQFDALFENGLYQTVGQNAVEFADQIRTVLTRIGIPPCYGGSTNQIFVRLSEEQMERLRPHVELPVFESDGGAGTLVRFVTSWATSKEDVNALCEGLSHLLIP